MSKIFVTGDIHQNIDISKLNSKNFPEGNHLTKDDYLIICGDVGITWDKSAETKYWQEWLSEKPWTTIWCDGNHENFDELNSYPIEDWNGGKVHKITDSLIHLMRGEVFTLNGKKFFVMGGGDSIDKYARKPHISWWSEEMPSFEEYNHAMDTLEKNNYKVDYIITHVAPSNIMYRLNPYFRHDQFTDFLYDEVYRKVEYDKWYFGHYHMDKKIGETHICLYQDIIQIM